MKFAEHLTAHITPEWRKQYINYEKMKDLLYDAVERAPSTEGADSSMLVRYFAKFDQQFFRYCDKERTKINTFYSEKLAEATRKAASLKSELSEAKNWEAKAKTRRRSSKSIRRSILITKRRNVPARKMQDLKLAYSEFYLSLILLQNYQNLNFIGFRKILKKHDKLLNVDLGASWLKEHVENSHFYTNKDVDLLILETETTVTQELEGGNRQRAMKRLRVPPLGDRQSPWVTFKVGLFSGAFIVLIASVILAAIFHRGKDDWRIMYRLYRGPFLIIEFLFLWGINIYGWRSFGVNHVLIFELDPRNHLSEQHVVELAAMFGIIWSLSILGFLFSSQLSIPAYVNPLILLVVMVAFFVNPSKTFRHEARFWALRVVGRVLLAPFFHVNFADFWLADQLNSLVDVFRDLHYSVCFFATNHDWTAATDANYCMNKHMTIRLIMTCLPAWFRFAQCLRRYRDTKEVFPHLVNAGKYSTTFFVVIFTVLYRVNSKDDTTKTENPFFYTWIAASIVSSCYAYAWDILFDWGLFDSNAGDNKFLREEVVYSSNWLYYLAIVEDLMLRFGWVLAMLLSETGHVHADVIMTILAPLEVFRRFVWNFFRLENEHLNNCGQFRAVRDISIVPLQSSDQSFILRMMDEEDTVINRRSKRDFEKKRQPAETLDGE